jgi:phosphatidylinositol alpha 1,6-mannosyltransferase
MTAPEMPVRKRIALFTGNYNHIADGVSLTLNRLVAHLEEEGADVLVFGPTIPSPPIQHEGRLVPVPSINMPGRPEYQISTRFPRKAKKELAEFQPNLIHIATPDLLGFSALRQARKQKIPVVASYHTHFSSYLKFYGLGKLEGVLWHYLRWFYAKCQHLYVPSDSMADVLKTHGIKQEIKRWERGVDVQRFSPGRRSLAWRRSHGIGDDEVVVTFVSRLVLEKRLDVFVSVVQELEAQGIPHRSMMVGDGPTLNELEAQLPNTVFTGYLTGDDLAQAYASCDIFLFPSDTETFGNVTLEAMASGLPTICADATGSRSLVQPGVTGFLAPPSDAATFLKYTERLVTNTKLRKKMGEDALQRAQDYAWPTVLARIIDYYDQVLTEHQDA